MAEKSFGFNSAGTAPGDRAYSAADYMFWLNVHFGGNNGVIPGFLNGLEVTSLGAYSISVNSGGAVYSGYAYSNDSASVKVLDSVDTTYKRYDRIVVRFDAITARLALLTVIKGTASTGSPSIPSAESSDVTLATVYVDNTSGTPSFTVTDNRSYRLVPLGLSNVVTANIADSSVTDAKAGALTSSAMASGYKFRAYVGGNFSSGVTLPTIAVGETLIFWMRNVTGSNISVTFPSGTYSFSVIDQSGVFGTGVNDSSASGLFRAASSGNIIYTRSA